MSAFSFVQRCLGRQAITMAALTGLVLLLASTRSAYGADDTKADDGEKPAAKAVKPPPPPKSGEAGPGDDFRPPRRPRPPRGDDRPGDPDQRRPGPPDDEAGPPRQPGAPQGPDGPPRGPGRFGQGQPFGPQPFGQPFGGQPFGFQPGGPRRDMASLEKTDPEMYKLLKAENDLDRRSREAAQEYRDAAKGERTKLKEGLKKLVTEQFEVRQQRRKLELTRFEEELKRLRDAADRREKNSQQIIDKRVSELLGEDPEGGF